jgi:hypothetical protein
MAAHYRRSEPSRFELALWSDETLCGLAVGKVRLGYCGVNFLEGSPIPGHPLKGLVIPAVLTCLTAYAKALGKREIRIFDPLPEMMSRYEALGFVLATLKDKSRYVGKVVP